MIADEPGARRTATVACGNYGCVAGDSIHRSRRGRDLIALQRPPVAERTSSTARAGLVP